VILTATPYDEKGAPVGRDDDSHKDRDDEETIIGGTPVPTPTQAAAGASAAAAVGGPDCGEDDAGQEPHDGPTSPPRQDPRE
jgi:hypothetical protein